MPKEVVIVGGSYAAMYAAKHILSNPSPTQVRLTVIAPSKHAYFGVASPRLLVEPELIPKTFFDVEATLTRLSSGPNKATFVKGSVVSVDLAGKRVALASGSEVAYDNLIIATGTKYDLPGFKLDSAEDSKYTEQGLNDLHASIEHAEEIAIIGGGPTGVEIAGELGFEYNGKKKVTLYTGSANPLPMVKDSIRVSAVKKLRGYGVEVINNKKVTYTVTENKTLVGSGKTDVREFDLVIPVHNAIPNSSFLEKYEELLDAHGGIKTDEYLRLKGHKEVLVIGDVVSGSLRSLVDLLYKQKAVFEASIDHEIFGKDTKRKPYDNSGSPVLLVPISRNGGVGTAFGLGFPNFVVKMKSKDFFISKAGDHFT